MSRDDLQRIFDKLDSIENKLNNHLERIAKAETKIDEVQDKQKGFIKVVVSTVGATVVGSISIIIFLIKPFFIK